MPASSHEPIALHGTTHDIDLAVRVSCYYVPTSVWRNRPFVCSDSTGTQDSVLALGTLNDGTIALLESSWVLPADLPSELRSYSRVMASRGRRSKGEGTVYFDASVNAWVGQASVGVNPISGKRRRLRVSAATKREAHRRLLARMEYLERTAGAATPGTVGELLKLWLSREAPKTMSPRTLTMVKTMVANHLMPAFGQIKVSALRAEDVERLLDEKAVKGLARSSLVKLHSYLGQAYDAGVRRRLVGWNPARVAVIPAASAKRRGRALTPTEARSLLKVAEGNRLGAWVIVALSMGLRPGEISGLTWDAVDLDVGRIVVYRSLGWDQGNPELKAPKSKRARTLTNPDRVTKTLRRHRQAQLEERLRAGPAWPRMWESLVFVTESGGPLRPETVRRLVRELASAAGIDGGLTPYDLRHTATSVLSASGVAPELLADLLGHVDTRMVFKHYRHPVTPAVDVAAKNIERALKG